MKLYGTRLSPFVRKILLVLEYKHLSCELEVVVPTKLPDGYTEKIHPLGKIPALVVDGISIPDSSAICQYLEKIHPDHSIYPQNPMDYAQALWLEEYADTRVLEVCGGLFFENFIRPTLFSQKPESEKVNRLSAELLPKTFQYLETRIINQSLGSPIADFSVCTQITNMVRYTDFQIDATLYPKLQELYQSFLSKDFVQKLMRLEDIAVSNLKSS